MRTVLSMGIIMLSLCTAMAGEIESAVSAVSVDLARQYRQDKEINFQKNIIIGDFENQSKNLKDRGVAESVRDLFLAQFARSTIFTVVERRNMKNILREHELQLSGLTDQDTAAKAGRILNADAILVGSITELNGQIRITVRLIDIETARVLVADQSVPRDEMLQTAERLADMRYVQKMGVGISLNLMTHTVGGNEPGFFPAEESTFFLRPIGVEFKYRFTKNFMAGMGFNWVTTNLAYFPNFQDEFQISTPDIFMDEPFLIDAMGFSIPINVYFNYNATRTLNLFVTGGIEPVMLNAQAIFTGPNGGGMGFGPNEQGPEVGLDTLAVNGGIGVEYFFTPRLAISVKCLYTYCVFDIETDEGMDHLGAEFPVSIEADMSGLTYSFATSFFF